MAGEIIKERMVRNLKAEIVNHWGGDDNPQETLVKMYLTDLKDNCMPDDYIGEDYEKRIIEAYGELVDEQHGKDEILMAEAEVVE